ncbi:kelch domain-containing protein 10-like [Ruditapes philippinarum]|uniref:kelch domain-containing protein 10-like n=1 Tax=Ruditapes philippinarum TaxID=129788 RepID=UPI00295C0BA2|nr:kelch domain-containing protein 10-like [Ruditapes philippinarum]
MFQSICPLHIELKNPEKLTEKEFIPRSGHRIVVDEKYVYSWGGYNYDPDLWDLDDEDHTYPLLKELWRYQIWTGEWKLLKTHGDIPTQLASHHLVKVKNHLLQFGGTGVPFGSANTNCLYDLDLDTLEWKVLLKPKSPANDNDDDDEDGDEEEDNGVPRPKYGHSLTQVDNCLYVIGGTCGYVYDSNIHKLDLNLLTWEEIPVNSKYIPQPRYRHEVIYYKGKLLMFGGGAGVNYSAFNLDKIDVFDLDKQTWEKVMTFPSEQKLDQGDSKKVFPGCRRCHSCVRFKDDVYVSSGLSPDGILADMWRFHLPSYQWTALKLPLPKPVYFHSAAVTDDGCMFIFGGVTRIDDQRTNALQIMWVQIPPLKLLAFNTVVKSLNLEICKQNYQTLIALGIPRHCLDLIL